MLGVGPHDPNRLSSTALVGAFTDILPSYIPSEYDPRRPRRAAVLAWAKIKIRPFSRDRVQLPCENTSRGRKTRRHEGDFAFRPRRRRKGLGTPGGPRRRPRRRRRLDAAAAGTPHRRAHWPSGIIPTSSPPAAAGNRRLTAAPSQYCPCRVLPTAVERKRYQPRGEGCGCPPSAPPHHSPTVSGGFTRADPSHRTLPIPAVGCLAAAT
jgi:hypothetical protein